MNQFRSNPAVSIILPTYNRAQTLPRAIKSVLKQTFTDFELIIIDDASTDNTQSILAQFNEPRIKRIRLKNNYGTSGARNCGIMHSKGRYLAFIDSDDCWNNEKLKKQFLILDKSDHNVGVVFSAFWQIRDKKKKRMLYHQSFTDTKNIKGLLLRGNFITIHSLMRKECFDCVGLWDESLSRLGDWDLWLRISDYFDFICLNEPLVEIFESQDAISQNNQKFIFSQAAILEKHLTKFISCKKILAKHYYCLGRMYADINDTEAAKKYLKKAVISSKLNIKYRFFKELMHWYPNYYSKFKKIRVK
ncbi:MAG: glycosyltransferase family 2 protein [Candidatus Omnitrophota bacterium]